MYTKQEISKQKQAFWTVFGRYMKPVLSSDGEAISWLNYKTGNKPISFKMDADSKRALLSIIINHPDVETRAFYFDRFLQLKSIFDETIGETDWTWQRDDMNEQGISISTIHKELTGVDIFRREDWPAIISFFKPRVIAWDAFWSMVRYEFPNH